MSTESNPQPQRQPGHPAWCDQGRGHCEPLRLYPNGTMEWSHWAVTYIDGGRHGGRVSLYRVEHLAPDGRHNVEQGVDVEVEGTFTEDQVDEFVTVLQQAVRTARRGLDGTPGGLPAVIAAAEANR